MTNEFMGPADIAALTNKTGSAWGGDGAWWIIILFLFCFMGWGGNGLGRSASGAADNYVLASDFATLQRQIDSSTQSLERKGDGIANGLCDGFYTQAQLVNGLQQNMNTQGYETRNAINAAQVTEMQNANAIQAQLAQCCCENKSAIANVNYNMANNTCAITNAITNSTRDIIDNANANARAILEAQTAAAIEAKNEKIAEQSQQIFAYQLAASQQAQNNYLISQLRPAPVPAFNVAAPYSFGTGCPCA